MFKGFINVFNQLLNNDHQSQQSSLRQTSTSFKGKIIKDYILEQIIVKFNDPQTFFIDGRKQNSQKVCVYAIEKKTISQQVFQTYNCDLKQNSCSLYPHLIQTIQSANYIYLIMQPLSVPTPRQFQPINLLQYIQQVYKHLACLIIIDSFLVNSKGKMVYLPKYGKTKSMGKLFYDHRNKEVLAQSFCQFAKIAQNQQKKVSQFVIKHLGVDASFMYNKYFSQTHKSTLISKQLFNKNNISQSQMYPALQKQTISQKNVYQPQKQAAYFQPRIQVAQIQAQNSTFKSTLMPSDQQILHQIQFIHDYPNLDQQFSLRESVRAKNQNKQQSQQIKNIIENANRSMFSISKMPGKEQVIIKSNLKRQNNFTFQLYFQNYYQSFKHFKATCVSVLKQYSKGYMGIIAAFFISLIGVTRKQKLMIDLSMKNDIFELGINHQINYKPYIQRVRLQIQSQKQILQRLKFMICRLYIPKDTFEILQPFMIQNYALKSLTNQIKLQQFTFFYLTSCMKFKFQKNQHFINIIQFMYLILFRDYQILHVGGDVPSGWNQKFWNQRKLLIQSKIQKWDV